jgi:AcrR family transcriptional regulator
VKVVNPLRADAVRNRERIADIARQLFREKGYDAVSMDEVAKRAEVGVGTLYRHFPSREALVEAVYRNEVDQLAAAPEELLATLPPDVALERWMERFVSYAVTKRGMAGALHDVIAARSELPTRTREQLLGALRVLLEGGARAGVIRGDMSPEVVLGAMNAIWRIDDGPQWREQAAATLRLLMDGLRHT